MFGNAIKLPYADEPGTGGGGPGAVPEAAAAVETEAEGAADAECTTSAVTTLGDCPWSTLPGGAAPDGFRMDSTEVLDSVLSLSRELTLLCRLLLCDDGGVLPFSMGAGDSESRGVGGNSGGPRPCCDSRCIWCCCEWRGGGWNGMAPFLAPRPPP